MKTIKELEKVKKWAIENIGLDLSSFTYPLIKKATHKNFKKSLKQEFDTKSEFDNLKEDYEIFKIIKKWKTKKQK